MKIVIDISKTDFAFITHFTILGLGMLKYRDIQVNTLNAIKQGEVVKKGKWIKIASPLSDEIIVKCPFCHDEFIGNDVEHYNFCPICSADLRGETNE